MEDVLALPAQKVAVERALRPIKNSLAERFGAGWTCEVNRDRYRLRAGRTRNGLSGVGKNKSGLVKKFLPGDEWLAQGYYDWALGPKSKRVSWKRSRTRHRRCSRRGTTPARSGDWPSRRVGLQTVHDFDRFDGDGGMTPHLSPIRALRS
ncbi:hypothetical protein [Gordonia humi]|uniref:Uncharacterized protein n=1 Tax=Gordonia humi TaxID=686429 RepID=A0A840EV47_9ACTN|nr:hypothetical protein [Gordonia humi]MBB4134224.1 hypothetical protein [Gordonia humi]